jgi:hypothetical protein
MRQLPDGSVRVELEVSIDWALRRWILGFGAQIRVIAPSSLADDILDELDAARTQYTPGLDLDLDPPRNAWDLTSQRALPFAEFQRLSLVGEGRS